MNGTQFKQKQDKLHTEKKERKKRREKKKKKITKIAALILYGVIITKL